MKHRTTITSDLRLFIVLIIVLIFVTDIVSLASRANRTLKNASEEITQILSETNYQESTIRMAKMFPGQASSSTSMQALDLPNVPLGGDKSAKPVVFLYKRVIKDTLSESSPLEDLANGTEKGQGLADKLGTAFNAIKIDAKDIDFAAFDSLMVAAIKKDHLSSSYQLDLKRQKDTLEILGHKVSRGFHNSPFNKKFTHVLNTEGTVWYDYYANMLGVLFSQDGYFMISDIFFGIISLLMLVVLYQVFKESDKIDKESEDFLHMITHDMKSPVSVIKLACEELENNAESAKPECVSYLNLIERNCNVLQEKIETIIPLTDRLKAGVKALTSVHLSTFVSHIASNIKLNSDKDSIEVVIPESLNVDADPDLLDVIFRNLIENALKYGPKDAPAKVEVIADVHHNGKCFVTVKDNGIGISKEELPLIFKKFYRVSKDKKDSKKSFGLGLYSVKECISLLKWKIDVESTLGKGTSFIITIPETHTN